MHTNLERLRSFILTSNRPITGHFERKLSRLCYMVCQLSVRLSRPVYTQPRNIRSKTNSTCRLKSPGLVQLFFWWVSALDHFYGRHYHNFMAAKLPSSLQLLSLPCLLSDVELPMICRLYSSAGSFKEFLGALLSPTLVEFLWTCFL